MYFKVLLKLCCLEGGREETLLLFMWNDIDHLCCHHSWEFGSRESFMPFEPVRSLILADSCCLCGFTSLVEKGALLWNTAAGFVHTKGILHQEVMQSKEFSLGEILIILY